MPVDVFPEFAPPKVEIQTVALGLSAAEVEKLVTVPLEQALNGVPGLDVMRSQVGGAALADRDDLRARHRPARRPGSWSQERIAQVDPDAAHLGRPPFMLQPLSATSRVMKIGLTVGRPEST